MEPQSDAKPKSPYVPPTFTVYGDTLPPTHAHSIGAKSDAKPKRPYVPPTFTIYGDMATLTRAHAVGAMTDGGTAPNNMTA
jgi:hypothetical protein